GARPGPPTGVFAAIDDWSRIDLTWEPPVSDGGFPVTSYEVEIFNDGISDTYVVPVTSPLELRDEYLFHDPWNDSADNKVLLRAVNSLGAGEPVELSLLANVVPAKPGA